MTNWIELGIAVASGGAITKVIDFLSAKTKSQEGMINKAVELIMLDNSRLREDVAQAISKLELARSELEQFKEKYTALQMKYTELESKLVLMESAHMDLPFPMWLKDMSGVMRSMNTAYEDTILFPNSIKPDDYIGATDYDVWPQDLADQYRANDERVARTGKVFDGVETVMIGGNRELYRIIKFPRYAGRVKIGIAGIAIPISKKNE